MNSQRNNIIAGALLLILLIVAGYFLFASQTDWSYNLKKDKKTPYGISLIYELIKDKYAKKGFIEIDKTVSESFRKLKKNKTYNYIFIEDIPYYDSTTIDTIWRFVENGNTAFIACESLNRLFIDSILKKEYQLNTSNNYYDDYYDEENYIIDTVAVTDSVAVEDTTITNTYENDSILTTATDSVSETTAFVVASFKKVSKFNFLNRQLKDKNGYFYFKKYKEDTLPAYFASFITLDDSDIIKPIDQNNSLSFAGFIETDTMPALNFVILKHGKGQLIIMLSVLPFTNYFTRTKKGLEFVEKIIAHLPDQTTLYDNISMYYNGDDYDIDDMFRGHNQSNDSPLYFILNHAPLRWAWYLLLIGIILYGIYRAKRRQKIIAIIEPKTNTSLGYAETIGQLYFHEEEHIEIAIEMRTQFLNFIRNKYYLKTNELDESFKKQLSVKSGIEIEKINDIFNQFHDVVKIKSIHKQKLHHLNALLEYFYKTCK
ncbi:MAG: hypothetical protein U0U67_10095 [Chitinophagales bacterium]